MGSRGLPYRFDNVRDLAEARTRADELSLDERFAEAVAMYIVSVIDIARRSTDEADYHARITRDPPGCPTDRWRELQARRAARTQE